MSGQSRPEIVVVGAGIIGAVAAWQLQSRGANVTLVDAGDANATRASFGWINASFYHDIHHHRLRVEGMAAYARLADRLAVPLTLCGSLCWGAPPDELVARARTFGDLGYPVETLDTDALIGLEPALAARPQVALRFPTEVAVEQGLLVTTLLKAATDLGARILSGLRVTGLATQGDRVVGVRLGAEILRAETVILAAGCGSAALLQDAGHGLPMVDRPALVLRTRPVKPSLAHVLACDVGDIRQLPDGSFLMPASVHHQSDSAETLDGAPHVVAEAALDRLRRLFPTLDLDLAQVTLAQRPVPGDGLPAVGGVAPGLYLSVMHSGITLAAIMGELVADEVLTGSSTASDRWLDPYRPGRFSTPSL